MARLLFACELGEGLGHLNRLAAVAGRLPGHELVFAVGDQLQRGAIQARFGDAARVVDAPRLVPARPVPAIAAGGPDLSLAETLHRIGFAELGAVAAAAVAWAGLVARLRPDVVVGDYAPALRLAVGGRVPHVVLGNGFTVPPAVSPLPAYNGSVPPALRSREAEAAVLACFAAVRAGLGLPSFACLADALYGDATFVASYPFLDPYREHRNAELLQPFNLPDVQPGPPAAERAGTAVFAYLEANYPGVDAALEALNCLGQPAEVFVRNARHEAVVRRCALHVGVHAAPAELARVLPRARLLVHHGGAATAVAGLLAGTPQLLLPRHTEQLLNARGLSTLGTSVGVAVEAGADPEGLAGMMARLLDGREVAERADAVARELRAARDPEPERPVVEAVEAFLRA